MMQLADTDQEAQVRLAAFREELQKLGWRIGKNLQIDYRFGISNDERAQTAVVELLNLAPDLIFANSSVPLRAAKAATDTVPIVFTTVIDPVAQGFVPSLAHPGGNITGFSYLESSVGGKWLDRLKEVVPNVTHVALMFDPQRATYGANISRFAAEAAERHAVRYLAAPVNEAAEIETVMSALAGEKLWGGRRRSWHLHRSYELMEVSPWPKSMISAEA